MDHPRTKALARRENTEIYFGDATLMCSDNHSGRTRSKRAKRPLSTGARYRMRLISVITARVHMRCMIKGKGGVNSDVSSEFLKRLMVRAGNKIFLIMDRGPARVAKKTKKFVTSLGGQLEALLLSAVVAGYRRRRRLAKAPAHSSEE
jgi:hypothetical protein